MGGPSSSGGEQRAKGSYACAAGKVQVMVPSGYWVSCQPSRPGVFVGRFDPHQMRFGSRVPEMNIGKFVVGTAAAALVSGFGPALATANAEPDVEFIRTPDGNISCEMDFQRAGLPDGVSCSSRKPPQSLFMDINGVLKDLCSNQEACVSDGPENAVVLAYGQNQRLGPFNCLSEGTGMHCTVPSEHGFVINGAGIDPVNPRLDN